MGYLSRASSDINAPDAINQIMNSNIFRGSEDAVNKIIRTIDDGFIMAISIVSFLIISVALLRNVIAGAYVAFPKFWDKISETKYYLKERGTGGRDISFIFVIISYLLPDLKALSDFHDDSIEPKHYFTKAIPQMIATVMIGLIIFNGYYRDAVVQTAKVGQEIITRALAADPVEAFNRLCNLGHEPVYMTAGDESKSGKATYALSKDIVNLVATRYTDLNNVENEAELNRLVVMTEKWVMAEVQKNLNYWEGAEWSISTSVNLAVQDGDFSNLTNGDTKDRKSVGFSKSVTDFGLNIAGIDDPVYYVHVIVRFNKQIVERTNSGELNDITMLVPRGRLRLKESNGIITETIITGLDISKLGSSSATINNQAFTNVNDTIVIPGDASDGEFIIKGSFTLKVQVEGGWKRFYITSIKIVDGSDTDPIMFRDKERTEVPAFTWNEEPKMGGE